MKFAHIADCHLGGWRIPELQQLNFESFKKAIDICIEKGVDFVLIVGDLFDSAYPPIEILAETFSEFKKLKDAGIPCYIVAGSHDYSASGKTFLKVLEKSGFCKNIFISEEKDEKIYLNPTIHENIALYGFPGKKSSLEIDELKKVRLHDSPGFFRIFALHTSIKSAIENLPVPSINEKELPEVDYYALGHLHIRFEKDKFIYPGPIFPNNFEELEELKYGSFVIVETDPFKIERILLKLKDVELVEIEINDAFSATDKIIKELEKRDIKDKIILLKLYGVLKKGKTSEIDFKKIENFCKKEKAYTLLRNLSKLKIEETEVKLEINEVEKLEEEIIKEYLKKNKSKFDKLVQPLISALSLEKNEEETINFFSERLFAEINKIFGIE